MSITNITIHIVPLEESEKESNRMGSGHAYTFDALLSYINKPKEASVYYYNDEDSTEDVFKQLKKALPAGNEISMGFNTLKINKKFAGPEYKDGKKVVEKEWKDSGKKEFEKLFKGSEKPKLKVMKSQNKNDERKTMHTKKLLEAALRKLITAEATLEMPKNVKSIWDNGGKSIDRYTIVYKDGDMLGLSEKPEHPQGFSQFTSGDEGPHLGKKIKWENLPEHLKKHIIKRSHP
jgi:hypothetical protein